MTFYSRAEISLGDYRIFSVDVHHRCQREMFVSFLYVLILLTNPTTSQTTEPTVDGLIQSEYELITEDLLRIHSSSNITYHSLWNRLGFNGHDTQGNRRRDIIDQWREFPPVIVHFLYCQSGWQDCTENSYVTRITVDVVQYAAGGNVSKWNVNQCHFSTSPQSEATIESSCSFEGENEIVVGQWSIQRHNKKFKMVKGGTEGLTKEAAYFILAAVYNETVCPCDCVYSEKVEAAKNVTREKKSMAELKEQMGPQLREMEKNMTVDTSTLSAFVSKKISKDDKRKVSKQIGYVGIVFLTVEVSVLIILDLMSFRTHWEMLRGAWNSTVGRIFGFCKI